MESQQKPLVPGWSLVGLGQPGRGISAWGRKVGGVSNLLSKSVLSQVSSPRVTAFHFKKVIWDLCFCTTVGRI